MGDIFGKLWTFAWFGLPIFGAIYILCKTLKLQIKKLLNTSAPELEISKGWIKVLFSVAGISYGIFLISGLFLNLFSPAWFDPIPWQIILYIVLVVPYFTCVYGLYGLGYMGHGGVSPTKTLEKVMSDFHSDESDKKGKA